MGSVKFNLSIILVIGLLSALVSMLPSMRYIEQDTGVNWMFKNRGAIPVASDDAVIIAMDSYSANQLGLLKDSSTWPRSLHAALLEKLTKAGARSITFDVFFHEKRQEATDKMLLEVIAKTPRLTLYQKAEKKLALFQSNRKALATESLLDPAEFIVDTGVNFAPFPLPAIPQRVTQFWTFKDSLGGVATLPVISLHQFLGITPPMFDLSVGQEKKLTEQVRQLHESYLQTRQLPEKLKAFLLKTASENEYQRLESIYRLSNTRQFNLYGPARSIKTYSYASFFTPEMPELAEKRLQQMKGKAVFIGFSEPLQWNQVDVFHTAFSDDRTGLNIAGVELLATAFINLLNGDYLQHISPIMMVLLNCLWAILILSIAIYLAAIRAFVIITLLAIGYFAIVSFLFNSLHLIVPVVQPLFLVLPGLMVLGMMIHFSRVNKEKKRIKELFGYYLPEKEISRLAQQQSSPGKGGQVVQGVCMSTDAENYTELSEQLSPTILADLINKYYESLFKPIRQHAGHISDVVGDAVMAIWADVNNPSLNAEACKAALEIHDLKQNFQLKDQDDIQIRTRIGLHWGEMVIGNVGALDHYEYRAVGDIVNTAARIEGVNKQLGTYLLASEEVIKNVESIASRFLGQFMLVGKKAPISLFELLSSDEAYALDTMILEEFNLAMSLLDSADFKAAYLLFDKNAHLDGPSRFYARYLKNLLSDEARIKVWDGIIVLEKK